MAKLRYIRTGDHLDDDTQIVGRGGLLDPPTIRRDAQRMHSIYGVYGISVFAVRDVTLDELAQGPPLVRFAHLTLMTVGVLRAVGLRIDPTGRDPRHYTITFDNDADAIDQFCAIERVEWDNPYHEP